MLSNLKIRLMHSKMTQRRLARRLHVCESFLSEVIAGKKRASPALRKKISKIIGEPEAKLFPASVQSSNAAPAIISSATVSQ